MRFLPFTLPAAMLAGLVGCGPDYSPNTYGSNAVQQANKVESAVVVGFRQIKITASGTIGAVSGGAAGGVLGAQAEPSGIVSALGAVGGTVVGGIVGTTVEHVAGDTTGWEYIVRKANGDLLSVTQREPTPIPLGQKVLVITGNQARIVPDYSVAADPAPAQATSKEKTAEKETPAAPTTPVAASTAVPAGTGTPSSTPAAAAPGPATSTSEATAPTSTPAPAQPAAATSAPAALSADKASTPASAPQEAAGPRESVAPSPPSMDSETAPQTSPQ